MEPDLGGDRSRRHIMSAAEGGEKVVKRIVVGQVDYGKLSTPTILVSVEEIILTQREIEEISRRDAGRIVIVVLGSRRRNLN